MFEKFKTYALIVVAFVAAIFGIIIFQKNEKIEDLEAENIRKDAEKKLEKSRRIYGESSEIYRNKLDEYNRLLESYKKPNS